VLKKALSQNLIRDRNILGKMVAAAGLDGSDTVVEIGAGQGSLTRELCGRVARVTAVELDREFIPFLKGLQKDFGNLTVVEGDVLAVDFRPLAGGRKIKVFGNIPYGITGPILFKLLDERFAIESAFITLQREVAERLVSPPRRRSYGALSVIFQLCADMKIHFHLKPHVFTPPPKVDSSFISILFREHAEYPEGLFGFVKHCFGHKRKLLRNSLLDHYDGAAIDGLYAAMGFDRNVRAEEIDHSCFPEMYKAVYR
jgi:16S rRNA (adenine1518-N6/adenine1519-N6)-dimethyltransferase